jgi:integrase
MKLHTSGLSYWFAQTILRKLNLKTPQVSLHCTRHTTTVLLERARCPQSLRHKLLGHSLGQGVEEAVYLQGLQYSLTELRDALNLAQYPFDMEAHGVVKKD